jgi:hypothetical protein
MFTVKELLKMAIAELKEVPAAKLDIRVGKKDAEYLLKLIERDEQNERTERTAGASGKAADFDGGQGPKS